MIIFEKKLFLKKNNFIDNYVHDCYDLKMTVTNQKRSNHFNDMVGFKMAVFKPIVIKTILFYKTRRYVNNEPLLATTLH